MKILHICPGGTKIWGIVDVSVPVEHGIQHGGPKAGRPYFRLSIRGLFREATARGFDNVEKLKREREVAP